MLKWPAGGSRVVPNCSSTFSKNSESQGMKSRKLQIAEAIVYAECLVQIAIIKGTRGKLSKQLPAYLPAKFRDSIVNKFMKSDHSQQEIFTDKHRQRVICHLIVLLLITQNFSVDMSQLTSCLHISTEKLRKLVEVVGARWVKEKKSDIFHAVLKLPIMLPDSKPNAGRRSLRGKGRK